MILSDSMEVDMEDAWQEIDMMEILDCDVEDNTLSGPVRIIPQSEK